MSAISAMLRGRAAALALMTDTITVTRLSGEVTDGDLGTVVKSYTTIYPAGPGKIQRQPRDILARPGQVGEAQVYTAHVEVHLPVTATGVASDDIVTVVASQDPDLAGRTFHIKERAGKTWETAKRFGADEVTS